MAALTKNPILLKLQLELQHQQREQQERQERSTALEIQEKEQEQAIDAQLAEKARELSPFLEIVFRYGSPIEKRKAAIIRAILDGKSNAKVAAEYSISRQRVQEIVSVYGIKSRNALKRG